MFYGLPEEVVTGPGGVGAGESVVLLSLAPAVGECAAMDPVVDELSLQVKRGGGGGSGLDVEEHITPEIRFVFRALVVEVHLA